VPSNALNVRAAMPSLIYIARIRNLSEELARSLRSAGCHVQSFKPGDITQDECLLAMTPEAADTALHPARVATETGRHNAGTPTSDLSQQLGPDTAVLNCLKAAVAGEIHMKREPVRSAVSTAGTDAMQSAVPAAESAPQAVSSRHEKGNQPIARTAPPVTAPSLSEVPREAKKTQLAIERCYRILRSPLSTVVAVLVLAVAYRGLPSITASPGRAANRSASGPAVSSETSHPVPRVQRHVSLDGFVAEDFTNHLGLHASGDSTQQNVDLKHPPRSSTPKRIVVD
jgi:hypothetical protein